MSHHFFLYHPEGWRASAACAGGPSSKFFPPSEALEDAAREVCQACPVRRECLAYALATRPAFGIWGGLNPDELAVVRRSHSRPELLVLGPDEELMDLYDRLPSRQLR